MAWNCCGEKVYTPFCSTCGKAMIPEGIEGLLAHLRTAEIRTQIEFENACRHYNSGLSTMQHMERKEKTHSKWYGFRRALECLIEQAGGDSP